MDNFSLKNAYTNHNRRKFVFLRQFLGGIHPATLAGLSFANLLKWDLCRIKVASRSILEKLVLFAPQISTFFRYSFSFLRLLSIRSYSFWMGVFRRSDLWISISRFMPVIFRNSPNISVRYSTVYSCRTPSFNPRYCRTVLFAF